MAYEGEIPWYSRALDFEALAREFPPPPDYFRSVFRISRDELRARQEERFLATVKRGWEIPFFQRHWGNVGARAGRHSRPRRSRQAAAVHGEGIAREHRAQPAVRRLHGHHAGGRRADAARAADQRRHHRPAAADAVCAARPRDDGDPRRTPLRAAWRAARRSRDGHVLAGSRQRRHGAARSDLALHRRRAGDDRKRRQHADAPADRDRQGVGRQRHPRLSVLPATSGDRRQGGDGHRSAQPRYPRRSDRISDRKIASASKRCGMRPATTPTARTRAA